MKDIKHVDNDIIELNLINRINDIIDEMDPDEGDEIELDLGINVDATVEFADEDNLIAVEGYICANDEAHEDAFSVSLRVRSYFKYRARGLTEGERDEYADMALDEAREVWNGMLSDLSDDTGTPLIELGPMEETAAEDQGVRLN